MVVFSEKKIENSPRYYKKSRDPFLEYLTVKETDREYWRHSDCAKLTTILHEEQEPFLKCLTVKETDLEYWRHSHCAKLT